MMIAVYFRIDEGIPNTLHGIKLSYSEDAYLSAERKFSFAFGTLWPSALEDADTECV